MLTSNEINHFTWAGMQWQKAFSIFRNARVNYNHWSRWDYSGKFLYQAFNTNTHATFKNNWSAGQGLTWNLFEISNNALRGASALRLNGNLGQWAYINSDYRKKVHGSLEINNAWAFAKTARNNNIFLSVTVQAMDALKFTLSGAYTYFWKRQDQFVSNINYNNINHGLLWVK